MGFMDNLRKLTQPYGEEDDFFEGADSSFAPQESEPVGDAQMEFESSFAEEPASAPEPATKRSAKPPRSGGLFSRSSEPRSSSRPAKTGRGRAVSSDQSVVRFNPRSFDEAGELVSFLEQGRSRRIENILELHIRQPKRNRPLRLQKDDERQHACSSWLFRETLCARRKTPSFLRRQESHLQSAEISSKIN